VLHNKLSGKIVPDSLHSDSVTMSDITKYMDLSKYSGHLTEVKEKL
jgi:hypothetical protein